MRTLQGRLSSPLGLRRQIERLEGLPLRPCSARSFLQSLPDDGLPVAEPSETFRSVAVAELDPGWVIERGAQGRPFDPLSLVAERPWWPNLTGPQAESLMGHWRHAVAVSQASRRLARDAGDVDPDRVARAGLLHGLGRWAIAAIDPQWLTDWMGESSPRRRLDYERRTLGIEVSTLGRSLAERWGCDPLVADAAWLHADQDRALNGCASDANRLALIQEAYAWAERTPWALAAAEPRDSHGSDPRLRLLMAEVQVRCQSPFVEADATPHEERLSRSNARLRRQLDQIRATELSRELFLEALERSEPTDSPETWAERAGLTWCGEPGITAARVVWLGPESRASAHSLADSGVAPTVGSSSESPQDDERPATVVVPLVDHGRRLAEVHLWTVPGHSTTPDVSSLEASSGPWQAWAALVSERARLSGRLDEVVRAHRDRVATEEPRLRKAKLDALAEFAAGAGHELNNPLAVIVGRAQLLLVRESDPGAVRSLRAILTQAQRAHRILRDLMYVARPPEPRPRFCQPEEIVRNCVRDLRDGTDERGIRLLAEARGSEAKVWADPEALRHLTEILLRNALEATPKGGTVQVITTTAGIGTADALNWTVQDNGRGMTAAEGAHLFDPFFCGRQAGRGLGLGLPRASRIVSQSGGEIRWHTTPGQGTTFHVHLPLTGPPPPLQSPAESISPAMLASKEDPPLPRS